MTSSNNPRTSVIIPARNAGKTLAETLDSLLAQSDPDWEALIVDDGSTDETANLIKSYAQRDGRFVGLQGAGVGASGDRNIGLARAAGRRVLFLDSDDWIDDRFLELMNGALEAAPDAVAAYCGDLTHALEHICEKSCLRNLAGLGRCVRGSSMSCYRLSPARLYWGSYFCNSSSRRHARHIEHLRD